MEILGDGAVEDGRAHGTETEDKHLNWRRILSGQAEGSRVVVVDLVDVLVKEGENVHGTVGPVVPRILEDEENGNLIGHLERGRERYASFEAEVLSHGVEQPDLGQLDGEVAQQHQGGALPLLLGGGNFGLVPRQPERSPDSNGGRGTHSLNLVLVEERDAVDDDPRQRATKVDDLVHDERHDAGGQDIVVHVGVPGKPEALEVIEGDIVLRNLVESLPVGVGGRRAGKGSCR
ncbi:hypothetical protein MPH_02662 [Macrophomina phaseolina MS6]|uniref:Uncharacterized protein n=1 Tax=Macrophomina phaseolina (strain MS6) TaxID=1126212 RepID=K2RBY6_MACPH|nr:hypothetical protein MPH_02662 [Macrophomina phaseolina MS6]